MSPIPCRDCIVLAMCKTRCQVYSKHHNIAGIDISQLTDNCETFLGWWTVDWTNAKSAEIEKVFATKWILI